jgi:hypothetical protein
MMPNPPSIRCDARVNLRKLIAREGSQDFVRWASQKTFRFQLLR